MASFMPVRLVYFLTDDIGLLFRFLPTFGETRQFADFLTFFGMQRGRAAYAVTGGNLLRSPRRSCHPQGITKSGQEPRKQATIIG